MNKQKKSICISTFVFGDYDRFIPYYIYSILKSYPDYFVKIFVLDRVSDKVNKCLELISSKISPNFEIKENFLLHIPLQFKKNSQLLRTYRWLIPKEEFRGFDYVYIGDIDFLIVKEEPSLLDYHIKHCNIFHLPYSNVIRPKQKRKRLTGLHFFHIREYYEKMGDIINHYRINPYLIQTFLSQKENKMGRSGNEDFLYMIVEEAIGFGNIKKYPYRPDHGFHLGSLRDDKLVPGYLEFAGYFQFIDLVPNIVSLRKSIGLYFSDHVFSEILRVLPLPEILYLQKNLEIIISQRRLFFRKLICLLIIAFKRNIEIIKRIILILKLSPAFKIANSIQIEANKYLDISYTFLLKILLKKFKLQY